MGDALSIMIGTTQYSFEYPPSPYMRGVIMGIFKGDGYPIFPLPDYSPATIVDVGANLGASALWFHSAYPNARIYCYEPGAENFGYLQRNTAAFPMIVSFPCGLYDRDCETPLYHGMTQSAEHSVMLNPATSREHSERVRLLKVSDELKRLDLKQVSILKIDTEGCEIPILREFLAGAEVEQIYIEYHSEEDRRQIEQLTAGRFALAWAHVTKLNLGICLYLSQGLLTRYPSLNSNRITHQEPGGG